MLMTWKLLNLVGLIAGFVGTLMTAVAIGKNPAGGALTNEDNTERIYFATVNRPGALKAGLALIALGFALQFGAAYYQP